MTELTRRSAVLVVLALTHVGCAEAHDGAIEPSVDAAGTPPDEAASEAMPSSDIGSPFAEDAERTLGDEALPESGDSLPSMGWEGGHTGPQGSSGDGSSNDDARSVASDSGSVRGEAASRDGETDVGGGLCTYGSPTSGTGSFTWYYFGQGTPQQDGEYLTACGYQGRETGMIDTVQNI